MVSLLFLPISQSQRSAIDKDVNILHVISHPLFAIPGIVRNPSSSKTIAFQPIDFLLFNRSNRPAQPPPEFTYALWSEEKSKAMRQMGDTLMNGGNRSGAHEDGKESSKVRGKEALPLGVMGDLYPQFVARVAIMLLSGHLTAVKTDQHASGESTDTFTATGTVRVGDGAAASERRIDSVVAIIDATDFDTLAPLDVLSPSIKRSLNFSDCDHMPLHITTSCLTQHPSEPTLGITGYSATHWGVFEVQARTLAHRWLCPSISPLSLSKEKIRGGKAGRIHR
jgi:hypothetical protein